VQLPAPPAEIYHHQRLLPLLLLLLLLLLPLLLPELPLHRQLLHAAA
jgi:hypothetical protein